MCFFTHFNIISPPRVCPCTLLTFEIYLHSCSCLAVFYCMIYTSVISLYFSCGVLSANRFPGHIKGKTVQGLHFLPCCKQTLFYYIVHTTYVFFKHINIKSTTSAQNNDVAINNNFQSRNKASI